MRSKLLVFSGTYLKTVRKHTAASKLLRLSLAVCAKSGVKIEDCGFRTMQEVPSTPSVIKLHFEGEPGSKSFNSWREEFARKIPGNGNAARLGAVPHFCPSRCAPGTRHLQWPGNTAAQLFTARSSAELR